MESIIVVFPRIEDAKGIKALLVKNGFRVDVVCSTGAFALERAHSLNGGIVISGYKMPDMLCTELSESLPPQFEMLLVASEKVLAQCPESIMSISMPVKIQDFVNTIHMMFEAQYRRRKKRKGRSASRNEEEQQLIEQAKTVLMERNHMTEAEAHRYIQKCSMDSGTPLAESAQMVLDLYFD